MLANIVFWYIQLYTKAVKSVTRWWVTYPAAQVPLADPPLSSQSLLE